MDSIANSLGINVSELTFAVAMIGVFPLALIHRLIWDVKFRLLYSLIFGILLSMFLFGIDFIHFFVSSTITFGLIKFLPLKKAPFVVLAFNLIYLGYGHLERQFADYLVYTLDWTLPQMMLCCKLSGFAWCYFDGQQPEESIPKHRLKFRIKTLPSLLEFYSWVFLFTGFVNGPYAEFNDFKEFIDRSAFKRTNGIIPSSLSHTSRKICYSLIGFIAMRIQRNFNITGGYMLTQEFAATSFLYKVVFLVIAGELVLSKYYFAFYLGEAACETIGLSYNGTDDSGNHKWDKISMVRFIPFKTSTTNKDIIINWNIATQIWLRDHIFARMAKYCPKQASVFLTFIVSGIWHGFYPGYYLFFVNSGFAVIVFTKFHNALQKYGVTYWKKQLLSFVNWLLLIICLDYMILAFDLLAFEKGISMWNSVNFLGHLIGITVYVFTIFVLEKKKIQ